MAMSRSRGAASASNHYSNIEFINQLNKYIPSLVLQQLIKRDEAQDKTAKLPELQPMETVVVFADISGFTNLSEACAKKGTRGNEELAFCINRYMEGMVTNLNQYGGDIIKFVGDAMIVMWPPIDTKKPNYMDTRNDTIRRAIQCAQDIQRQMNNMVILPGATLSVKIGIGYGTCALLYVGGVFSRSESFTIGDALMLALRSEGQASAGGQIIVAEAAFMHVREHFRAKELIDNEDNSEDKFYMIDYKHQQGPRVKIQADAMKLRSQFSSEVLARIQPKMQGCVASAIIPYLQIDQERYGSENRSLTVAFVSLGVELSSASSKEGMDKIQSIVTAVQKQVYRMQGSLNKLVMDDKGSTLICVWGMLPFSHPDDASRAILAAFNMIKALNKIDGTYCNVGISSGECFSGVVGTSGSRKEFSVLGDVVNLAARIMGSIKKQRNSVRCDQNTRMLAGNFFDFRYDSHNELKGKSISIPFYEPINPELKYDQARYKVLSPDYFLQVHPNPLNLERTSEIHTKVKTLGFQETMNGIIVDITDYYSESEDQQEEPYLVVIKGIIGSGKTAFARQLVDELHQQQEFAPYLRENKQKLPIFTSTINAETQLHFLAAWKPIFQMMLVFFCKKQNTKKETLLADCIAQSNNFDKTDFLCDMLGVDKQQMLAKRNQAFASQFNVPQAQPNMGMFDFVTRPDYSKQEKEELVEFLTQFMKCLIGEENDISGWHSIVDPRSKSRQDISGEEPDKPPYIIIIDNAHDMCPTSWTLLEEIVTECYRLVVILLVQSDDMDRMKIHEQSIATFEQVYDSIADRIQIVEKDLPRLNSNQIGEMIRLNAQKYRNSFMLEMKDMTKIIDYNNTIKTDQMGEDWRMRLTEKWQLSYTINQIDEQILNIVAIKCRGNPLLCLQYFINLLHNDYCKVLTDGTVIPTEKFLYSLQINDWVNVPVPRLALKINTSFLDQYYYSIQMKGKNARPGELQGCTTSIVLLKAASVLGEEFELKALKHISPFPKSGNSSKRVQDAIRLLEQHDFIEIVDETDHKNSVCRFNMCFLRESTYQTLLYKSCKKDLHTATEKYLQMQPNLTSLKDNSLETEKLLQHMLLAQDTTEEADLLIERRTALVVLRVQNLINTNPRGLILKDRLYKQGDSINKNVSKRLCTLTQNCLKWYHDNDEEFYADKFMGAVELPFIYDVVKSKQSGNERPAFMISVTMFTDKKGEEKPKRNIFFSCESEAQRDKWMIAIDYLKTRAIYDAYAKKNTFVNFISQGANEEDNQDDEADQRDHSNLLYDFGDQIKVSTSAGAPVVRAGSQTNSNIRDSINRKQSVFRAVTERVPITAAELVPKLKLLYKVGMVSFMHHLDQSQFKTKAVIAKSATAKQTGSDVPSMQLPIERMRWDLEGEIADSIALDEQRQAAGALSGTHSARSAGRDSVMSGYAHANNPLMMQKSESQRDSDSFNNNQRKPSNRSSSEHFLRDEKASYVNGSRRSSSISADHVMKTVANQGVGMPFNSLIKEEKEEDSSGTDSNSNNVLSKLTSTDQNNFSKQGRFSQEVAQAQLAQVLNDEEVDKKGRSMNYPNNSESSSKGMSTPPLNSGLLKQPNRLSSQGYSEANLDGRGEENEDKDSTSGFSPHVGTLIDRENRQTFASHTGDEQKEEVHKTNVVNEIDKTPMLDKARSTALPLSVPSHQHQNSLDQQQHTSSGRNHQHHSSSTSGPTNLSRDSNQTRSRRLGQNSSSGHRKDNSKSSKQSRRTQRTGNQMSNAAQRATADQSRSTDKQTIRSVGEDEVNQFHKRISTSTGPQLLTQGNNVIGTGAEIGKEADNKELSGIHNHYGSGQYYNDMSSSLIDPLLQANHAEVAGDKRRHNNSSISHSREDESQDQQTKLMESIGSMIKQQLNTNLSSMLAEQQQKMNKMAEQQIIITEQIQQQQSQLLNSSFHQSQQHQQQMQPAMSQVTPLYYPGQQIPSTPTQFQQLPQMVGRPVPLMIQQPHQAIPQPMNQYQQTSEYQSQFMLTSPGQHMNTQLSQQYMPHQQIQRVNTQPYQQSPYRQQNLGSPYQPQMSQNLYGAGYQQFNHRLNSSMAISDHSMGGITSKRSHKHLLDGANQPVMSKQTSETLLDQPDDEPADPMMEDDDQPNSNDFSSINRNKMMQNNPNQHLVVVKPNSALDNGPLNYELDLQDFNNGTPQRPIQTQSNLHYQQEQRSNQQLRDPTPPRQQMQPGTRSFHMPTSSKETVNLLAQLSDDNHTEYEATLLNRQANGHNLMSQQQTSYAPQVSQTRYHTKTDEYERQRLLSGENSQRLNHPQADQIDETISAKTVKPTYHQAFNQSGQSERLYGTQQESANQLYGQLDFADKPLVFPPPEKWTENQYAMYEEPLVAKSSSYDESQQMLAVTVRDTLELKMQQDLIPKGTQVKVLQIIAQASVCHVEYMGKIGLYKLQDFVKAKSKNLSKTSQNLSSDKTQKQNVSKSSVGSRQVLMQTLAKQNPVMSGNYILPQHVSEQQRKRQTQQQQVVQIDQTDGNMPTVSIEVSNSGSGQQHNRSHSIDLHSGVGNMVNQNTSKQMGLQRSVAGRQRGAVQDSTIEEMSPINSFLEEQDVTQQRQQQREQRPNFFREDPEKDLSKQLRGMTAKELANASKRLLTEDKAEHREKHLKLVERQKRKAQAVRKQQQQTQKQK